MLLPLLLLLLLLLPVTPLEPLLELCVLWLEAIVVMLADEGPLARRPDVGGTMIGRGKVVVVIDFLFGFGRGIEPRLREVGMARGVGGTGIGEPERFAVVPKPRCHFFPAIAALEGVE